MMEFKFDPSRDTMKENGWTRIREGGLPPIGECQAFINTDGVVGVLHAVHQGEGKFLAYGKVFSTPAITCWRLYKPE